MKFKMIKESKSSIKGNEHNFDVVVLKHLHDGWELYGDVFHEDRYTYTVCVIKPDRPGEARL